MDSLFNRNTNDVASNESTSTGAMPQYAVSDAPATVVNPLYAGESAGEHAAPAGSPVPTSDACAHVAEPAPQQAIPTKECDGKQPGRAANLLLVATLAAVCGLAGGLAGGAIMSAAMAGRPKRHKAARAACRAAAHRAAAPRAQTVPPATAKALQTVARRAVRRPRARLTPAARATLRQMARLAKAQTVPRAMRLQARAMALPPRRPPFPPSRSPVHIERHDHDQA